MTQAFIYTNSLQPHTLKDRNGSSSFSYETVQGPTSGVTMLVSCLDVIALVDDAKLIEAAAEDAKTLRIEQDLNTGIVLLGRNVEHHLHFIAINRMARELVALRSATIENSHSEAVSILEHYWNCAYKNGRRPTVAVKQSATLEAH